MPDEKTPEEEPTEPTGPQLSELFQFELRSTPITELVELQPQMVTEIETLKAVIDAGTGTLDDGVNYVAMVERANEVSAALASHNASTSGATIDESETPTIDDGGDPPNPEDPPADPPSNEDDPPADPPEDPPAEPEMTPAEAHAAVMAGIAVLTGQQNPTPAPAAPLGLTPGRQVEREIAPMVAGIAVQTENGDGIELAQQELTEADFGVKLASFMNTQSAGSSMVVGGWKVWTDEDVAEHGVGSDDPSAVMAAVGRFPTGLKKIDPVTAAPCAPGCVRRAIDDNGNMADPLDIFDEYPCDRGHVEYFKSVSLSEIDGEVTVWDEPRQAAFDAAYNTYHGLLRNDPGNTAAISTAWAALKAQEKRCLNVTCRTGLKAAVLPLAVCMSTSNEMGYSQPEAIAAYRAGLMRLMVRERNRQRRTMMQAYSHWYGTDGADYGGMGAFPVVYRAIKDALSIGSVKERIEEGNYVLGIDYGMLNLLEIDNISTNARMDDIREAAMGLPIRVLLDSAVGPAQQPFAADLVPIGPPAGALPRLPGTPQGSVANPFSIEIFNPSDFETFSITDVTLTATRGPGEALQNRVLNFFLETFEGMMKPGSDPSFTLKFWNLIANGRRGASNVVWDGTTPSPLDPDSEVPPTADTGGALDDTLAADNDGDGIPDLT